MSEDKTEMVEKEEIKETPKIDEKSKPKTAEELQIEIDALNRSLANKTEEAQRVHKKLEDFETAEKQKKDAEMTEMEKLQASIVEKENDLKKTTSELEQLKLNEKKREIAEEVGLPTLFALRIQGTTPEEMKADAMVLLGAIPKIKTTINATNPGNNSLSDKETDEERRKRLGLSR
jgi:predicted RNase H-like nuclease (RuvC/YqgF family)